MFFNNLKKLIFLLVISFFLNLSADINITKISDVDKEMFSNRDDRRAKTNQEKMLSDEYFGNNKTLQNAMNCIYEKLAEQDSNKLLKKEFAIAYVLFFLLKRCTTHEQFKQNLDSIITALEPNFKITTAEAEVQTEPVPELPVNPETPPAVNPETPPAVNPETPAVDDPSTNATRKSYENREIWSGWSGWKSKPLTNLNQFLYDLTNRYRAKTDDELNKNIATANPTDKVGFYYGIISSYTPLANALLNGTANLNEILFFKEMACYEYKGLADEKLKKTLVGLARQIKNSEFQDIWTKKEEFYEKYKNAIAEEDRANRFLKENDETDKRKLLKAEQKNSREVIFKDFYKSITKPVEDPAQLIARGIRAKLTSENLSVDQSNDLTTRLESWLSAELAKIVKEKTASKKISSRSSSQGVHLSSEALKKQQEEFGRQEVQRRSTEVGRSRNLAQHAQQYRPPQERGRVGQPILARTLAAAVARPQNNHQYLQIQRLQAELDRLKRGFPGGDQRTPGRFASTPRNPRK